MNGRKELLFGLILAFTAVFSGCAGDSAAVYVQPVSSLSGMGGIAPGDRFAGIIVSEHVAEIQKDPDKTIAEVLVREGDDVKEGEALFSYDTEELQLTLDKQKLEREQLLASIENYKNQITELEKDRNKVSTADKLQYTIQIQTAQIDLKEAELNLKAKEAEVTKSEDILKNATVVSPVTGRVQAVNENGTDNYGNPLPYISIQQSGSYRVKGTLGELQRGSIVEGQRLKVASRTNENLFWMGTVTLVDYENPTQGNGNNYYMGEPEEMTSSSKYPFYLELDSTEGLILGQHVYLEMAAEATPPAGIPISAAFVCYEENGDAYVWAEKRGKLEKRTVTLGDADDLMGTVDIMAGLTVEDYIAFPDEQLCREGTATTRSVSAMDGAEGGVS